MVNHKLIVLTFSFIHGSSVVAVIGVVLNNGDGVWLVVVGLIGKLVATYKKNDDKCK